MGDVTSVNGQDIRIGAFIPLYRIMTIKLKLNSHWTKAYARLHSTFAKELPARATDNVRWPRGPKRRRINKKTNERTSMLKISSQIQIPTDPESVFINLVLNEAHMIKKISGVFTTDLKPSFTFLP